jgi:hypothetical protein
MTTVTYITGNYTADKRVYGLRVDTFNGHAEIEDYVKIKQIETAIVKIAEANNEVSLLYAVELDNKEIVAALEQRAKEGQVIRIM